MGNRHVICLTRRFFALAALLVVITFLLLFFAFPHVIDMQSRSLGECYVGVASCGNNTAEALRLIDRVKTYTNLLVVQSGPVSRNETAINEICDYAVASGLKVIVYFGDLNPVTLKEHGTSWRNSWVLTAKDCWGFWGGDEKSPQIWIISLERLTKYGATLYIVFDDPAFPVESEYYQSYLWNAPLPY